jgi:cell division protein FtsL
VLVAAIVMSIVALNALVVNTTYRLQSVQERTRSLTDEAGTLEIEVAQRSAPSRVAGWARAQGMELPAADDVVSIRVPGILEQGRA